MDRHLFGVEDGFIHLFGTDSGGKDIFSRTLHAIGVSLAVGTLGVFISFVLALIIGGVAGYFGGWIDTVLQALMDTVKAVPPIPLFMALAAFIPAGMVRRNAVLFHFYHSRDLSAGAH